MDWPSLAPFVRPGYDRAFTPREVEAGLDVPVHDGLGVPPLYGQADPVAHRVSWVAGALPYARCGLPVAADWVIVPAGTPVLAGNQVELDVCERCAHDVVTVQAAPGRVIEGTAEERRALETLQDWADRG